MKFMKEHQDPLKLHVPLGKGEEIFFGEGFTEPIEI